MSLNIKSEEIHARVRRLAELTGVTQTAAVDDAVRRRLDELERAASGRAARVERTLRAIQADLNPQERDGLRRADEIYDEQGLPQ